MNRQAVDRRRFLQAAGVALALPALDAFVPCSSAAPAGPPRRFFAVCVGLGLHPDSFFPSDAGPAYKLSPYLEILKQHRGEFTVCSGLSHPDVGGGHDAEVCYLTAAPHPGQTTFRNSISLDQLAIEQLKPDTRFSSLVLSTHHSGISFNRGGVRIPPDTKPSVVFARLFLSGKPDEVRKQVQRLEDRRSVLDAVVSQTKKLQAAVGAADRERLDQYFSSVREVETQLANAREWSKKPKPTVTVKPPSDIANAADVIGRARLLYDLAHLALQTDSTRFVTLKLDSMPAVPPIPGVNLDYHNLSHHGKDPEKLKQLHLIETRQIEALRDFLGKMKETKEGGGTLLDHTSVLFGSSLGNASSHDNKNLPILLAGGGFKHGRHLAFDTTANVPLGKLYVSILQRLGVESDAFGSVKGRLAGLES